MASTKVIEKIDPREIRRKLGLNQQQFWSALGVTQSGGSRYESGRNMPRPVQQLLRLGLPTRKQEDWKSNIQVIITIFYYTFP